MNFALVELMAQNRCTSDDGGFMYIKKLMDYTN